ncbi:MAG: RNA polymerase subunit sigma-24, partial [Acidimicrobiia bacterium]|nr:RNA polymerase subunit sigma-24 [Acidimicrobiia bacterium]
MTSPPPNPDSNASGVESAWLEHHQRVLNIGYRMLSSVTDAEDVAQDVYARLTEAEMDEIDDVLGWLVTVTSRMC